MKKKLIIFFAVICLMVAVVRWMGVGFYTSSAAVRDLKTELEAIYGAEYAGKETENGTEDMEFVVEPRTWFLTNWNLRNSWSMDYEYECRVVFTNYVDGTVKNVRTITYQAVDPMGRENMTVRAKLDLDSKAEQTETK